MQDSRHDSTAQAPIRPPSVTREQGSQLGSGRPSGGTAEVNTERLGLGAHAQPRSPVVFTREPLLSVTLSSSPSINRTSDPKRPRLSSATRSRCRQQRHAGDGRQIVGVEWQFLPPAARCEVAKSAYGSEADASGDTPTAVDGRPRRAVPRESRPVRLYSRLARVRTHRARLRRGVAKVANRRGVLGSGVGAVWSVDAPGSSRCARPPKPDGAASRRAGRLHDHAASRQNLTMSRQQPVISAPDRVAVGPRARARRIRCRVRQAQRMCPRADLRWGLGEHLLHGGQIVLHGAEDRVHAEKNALHAPAEKSPPSLAGPMHGAGVGIHSEPLALHRQDRQCEKAGSIRR